MPIAPRPVGVLVALLSVVPLAWRRTAPATAAVVGSAAFMIPTHDGYLVLGYVVAVILFFSVGAYVEKLRDVLLVTAWGVATSAETILWTHDAVGVLGSLLVVLGPVVAGRILFVQRAQTQRLQRLTEELAVERARAEQTAVAEERARIARELHDVVGHEMTMIAIQSEAAASALRTAPERATQPVEAIRETAHRATAEMRAILGVLGTDQMETGSAVPGPVELEALVERARLLGVECSLDGDWPAMDRCAEHLAGAGADRPGVVDQRGPARARVTGGGGPDLEGEPGLPRGTQPARPVVERCGVRSRRRRHGAADPAAGWPLRGRTGR